MEQKHTRNTGNMWFGEPPRPDHIPPDLVGMVAEFHKAFEYEIPEEPCVPGVHTPYARASLLVVCDTLEYAMESAQTYLASCPNPYMKPECIQRVALITEELVELCRAMADDDPLACLDACEDLFYVTAGTLVALGLGPVHNEAFKRVHESNMSKLKDGKVVKDEHGKVVKGDWYTPVDLSDLVTQEEE